MHMSMTRLGGYYKDLLRPLAIKVLEIIKSTRAALEGTPVPERKRTQGIISDINLEALHRMTVLGPVRIGREVIHAAISSPECQGMGVCLLITLPFGGGYSVTHPN